ncbi:tyrosine-type recombinase/integrase [Micromonospora sp. NPDC050200]|uniref:tyrosine-type recombinase/integrase n=1 Tax=Micromonospora sp. NPDC050200 TaxID=3155664 RepID=UPI0033DE63AE
MFRYLRDELGVEVTTQAKKLLYVPTEEEIRRLKEALAPHMDAQKAKGAAYLFESSRKKPYSTRGIRALLARYAEKAGLTHNMAPHRLRHFLFTWLKEQGIDDALIQPYSGHASRTSLEIYSQVSLTPATCRSEARPPGSLD